jgi:predicted site-specific integrase-resolvase
MDTSLIEGFLRPKPAAEFLGVGLSTIWLYIRQGKLNARKLSESVTVISKADLMAFAGGQK